MSEEYHVEQVLDAGIHQFSYIVSSAGEAMIIDPTRDPAPYVDYLERHKLRLVYVAMTNAHSDFVGSHASLARRLGAQLVLSHSSHFEGAAAKLNHHHFLKLGSHHIRVLDTPGHTPDSICLVLERGPRKLAVFTGDTLLVGDVGRPEVHLKDLGEHRYAFYESLHALAALPPETLVFPGHRKGSEVQLKGRHAASSTIGAELAGNWALQDTLPAHFFQQLNADKHDDMEYFKHNVALNLSDETLDSRELLRRLRPLGEARFERLMGHAHAAVVDLRPREEYVRAHLPNSYHFSPRNLERFAKLFLKVFMPLVLISAARPPTEAVLRLANIGFDDVRGYLAHDLARLRLPLQQLPTTTAAGLKQLMDSEEWKDCAPLDVRSYREWRKHVKGALKLTSTSMAKMKFRLPRKNKYFVYCDDGDRSILATRFLLNRGYTAVAVLATLKELEQAGVPFDFEQPNRFHNEEEPEPQQQPPAEPGQAKPGQAEPAGRCEGKEDCAEPAQPLPDSEL